MKTMGGKEMLGAILSFQGCALLWANCWAFGPKSKTTQSS